MAITKNPAMPLISQCDYGKEAWYMSTEEQSDGPFDHRRYSRGDVHIVAQVREKGFGHHQAKIGDLSRAGCRVVTPMFLNPANPIFITLPGFAPLEARIIWHVREDYGCEFVNELHEAIYDFIVREHPTALSRS
jgi:hypothetical protein